PHPSFIELAKPYVFQHKLDHCLSAIGMNEAREDIVRLQGVQLIDNVRRSLQLPVRTFNTAVVYYHKFRLVHPDHEYSWMDAALSALFTACKIEDTLKKSREIICASINLKLPPSEQLTVDDPQFEAPSKVIIGLERLMLEGAGFDFRNRHPQKLVIKLARNCGFAKDRVGKTAYQIALDLYRTFAPLKQTTPVMAIACVELAARLCEAEMSRVRGETGIAYQRWDVTRGEVMETMLDLLDLYTHHRPTTLIGPSFHLDAYISVSITLNQEATASSLPRYTASVTTTVPSATTTAPSPSSAPSSATAATKAPHSRSTNGHHGGHTTATATKPTNGAPARSASSVQSPASELGTPGGAAAGTGRLGGTVRFMLDAARARGEKEVVGGFFRDEEEEYEVE
ncbi:cyclin-like protein, partial [Saccharata proteae CBS 121410]